MKNELLKEIEDFGKEINKYNIAIKKFKKKFPKANIQFHINKDLTRCIFVKKYGNKVEFFRTDRIFSQANQNNPLIEMERWSINSWSCSSFNKITMKEFINDYLEVDEEYIKEEIGKYKVKMFESIKNLEEDTIKKFKEGKK